MDVPLPRDNSSICKNISLESKFYCISECQLHQQANAYGVPLNFNDKCYCCRKFSSKRQLSLNFQPNLLYYCGGQMAMYIKTVKYICVLYLVLTLIFALPLSVINYQGQTCNLMTTCSPSLLLKLSALNSLFNGSSLNIMTYLLIAFYFAIILFSLFIRHSLTQIDNEINESHIFPSNFAVFCKLPFNHISQNMLIGQIDSWWAKQIKTNKQKMIELFPQLFIVDSQSDCQPSIDVSIISKKGIRVGVEDFNSKVVQKIIFSYNQTQFQALKQEMEALVEQFRSQSGLKDQQQIKKIVKMYEKKKKVLSQISKNTFVLIIFKKQVYSQYFHRKNNPSLFQKIVFFDCFRYFQLQKQRVQIIRGVFPTEIFWNNHHAINTHYFNQQIATWGVILLFLLLSAGFIYCSTLLWQTYSCIQTQLYNIYPIFIAAGLNIIALMAIKSLQCMNSRNKFTIYLNKQKNFIHKAIFLNCSILVISPFCILYFINNDMLWSNNGFILTSTYSILFFMLITQLNKYLNFQTLTYLFRSQIKQTDNFTQEEANTLFNKPQHHIEYQYSCVASVTFMTCFLSPFIPSILFPSFLWFVIQLILQKINTSKLYNQDTYHGNALSIYFIKIVQKSPLCFVLSNITVNLIAYQKTSTPISMLTIIINVIICIVSLTSFILPYHQINAWFFKLFAASQQKQNKQKLITMNYNQIKTFQLLYQHYNQPYLYSLKDNGRSQAYSTRVKIYQQMNTMSKTLSLSLKERLMNNQNPMINHVDKIAEVDSDQINNLYFQYQKKIHMNQSKPKVVVPPLFKKEANYSTPPQQQIINFYSVFSQDDEQAKKVLKKHIKYQLNKNALQL